MASLILVSRPDPASVTIRDALLDVGGWEPAGAFEGRPVHRRGAVRLAQTDTLHLHADHIDRALRAAGHEFDTLLFASKHKAESGKPALAVHPIGNWGAAEYGGLPGRVPPSAPLVMGRILRRLHAEARGLSHQVTYEATHHGPYVETPAAFVEIGTDEAAWRDPDLGRRVARALLAAETPDPHDDAPVLMGLGGSHYAARATDLAKAGRANFGHILPAYAWERPGVASVVVEALRGTAGCAGYFLEGKAQAPPEEVAQVFTALELGWWTEKELADGV